ncbi:MAG: family oxidoreductase [Thermoleophilia bacterium]|jgi:NADP-dependent 3-hydroxy acid dehydrogenase YdfG|nr:family oxidoreductase [Thermoleophilia bacterium]
MEPTSLDGRTLLITGASSGIGAAIAEAAVAQGARVVLGARRLDRLESLAERLGGADVARAVHLDVTQWQSNVDFVASAVEAFGQVDAVVANAGFGAPRGWLESTPEHWHDMVLTNVLGAAYTLRAALPELRKVRGDAVLTSSVAGRRVLPGSLYSATKHAVTAMAEALRLEVADQGVRVTSIEPGMVDTPFFDDGAPEWALQDEDVAAAVLFALTQPARATVSTITLRPSAQVT